MYGINLRTIVVVLGMILLGVTISTAIDIPTNAMSDSDEMIGIEPSSVEVQSAASFVGTWVNTNPNARGMIKFVITKNRLRGYMFHGYGKCSPTPCDWGSVPLVLYSNSVSSLNDIAGTSKYNFTFKNTLVTLRLVNTTLMRANDYNQFTDASARHNYFEENMLFKKKVLISAPIKLSPPNGSVFSHFPRTTTLKWSAVPGVKNYTVEVDCYHCCQVNKWCTDVNRTWQVVPGLTQTNYTFNFVGAQPGRWRVWAVDADGKASPKSSWWYFSYTK